MGMRLIVAAFIASFGLTLVQPRHLEDKEAVTNDGKIQDNLRWFLDSITNKDGKKTKTYRNILEQETINERAAFDTMKEELQLARQKNAHIQRNFNNKVGDIVPSKRQTVDNNHGWEKHVGGCSADNGGHEHGDENAGNCCMDDNEDNQGGCCQDEGNQGGCCQDEDNGGHAGGCCQGDDYGGGVAGDGCCQDDNSWGGPSRYYKRSVQPNEPGQVDGSHDEEIIKDLRESFMDNVKKADANTIFYFWTMLTRLKQYTQNFVFQMDEICGELHLEYPRFGNWTSYAEKVIDSAIAVVKNRLEEVEREQQR